jgi:FMN-dependent NADH-azoreductase
MKLLHVDSSILGDQSASRRLTRSIADEWRRRVPGLEVTHRDLAARPVGHLSGELLGAAQGGPEPLSAALRDDLSAGREALEEFLAADVVVVGAPMYNFSVPSQLKAWIDRLAVAGKTFRYTADGPVGLAGGKKVIVASTRGGLFGPGTANAAIDFQEPYLRTIFGFFGITDVAFVRAEGLALSPDSRAAAMAEAERQIAWKEAA